MIPITIELQSPHQWIQAISLFPPGLVILGTGFENFLPHLKQFISLKNGIEYIPSLAEISSFYPVQLQVLYK